MSKFNYGDVVRLKPTAIGWGSTMTRKPFVVSDEKLHPNEDNSYTIRESVDSFPDDFELVEAAPEKHVHYDMIVEWAEDPSRVVECKDPEDYEWREDNYPCWLSDIEYRFKPAEPERVFPETSLTEKDYYEIYQGVPSNENCQFAIAVANAAIKQYILDQEKDLTS